MEEFALYFALKYNPDKPALLSNLGTGLLTHYHRYGEIHVLQLSVMRLDLANRLTPLSHAEKPERLCALGISLLTRYNRMGQLDDLELALALHRLAVHLTPEGHPDRPARLTELGITMGTRSQCLGALSELVQAISLLQVAVDLTPDGHHAKPVRLANLAVSLTERYRRHDDLEDLERAISAEERALELTPEGHPDKPVRLANLAVSLGDRYKRHGELGDLARAISIKELALELTPEGHPDKPVRLASLAVSFWDRYRRHGELEDLERAISMEELALELTPEGHPDTPDRLANIVASLGERYRRHGEPEDLERAISGEERALELTPEGHPDKPVRLANLAVSLGDRYRRHGEVEDLERAISVKELALKLTPEGHSDKPVRLSSLAVSLGDRYQRHGELKDLEGAISTEELALELTPEGHPDKPVRLANLAVSLGDRYRRHGEFEYLERAISVKERALGLTPEGHPDKPVRLSSLAASLGDRYQRHGELEDLEGAISTEELALELTPEGHPDRPGRIANLAVSLVDRYRHRGALSDLERAITFLQHVVELTPVGHPAKPVRLESLAVSLSDRYNHGGRLEDLEYANVLCERAVKLTPDGHPDKVLRLYLLGLSARDLFQIHQSKSRFDTAIDYFMKAATQPLGDPSRRLGAAQECVSLLSRYTEFGSAESLLLAHSQIIQIFPEIVWLGHSIDGRFERSANLGSLVNDAVYACIQTRPTSYQAIEWMETGRSLIWSQISSLRVPVEEELRDAHPKLALDLDAILLQLNRPGNIVHPSLVVQDPRHSAGLPLMAHSDDAMSISSSEVTLEAPVAAAASHRRLVIRYESLLKEIRGHAGFENFLRPPGIESMFPLIKQLDGPVIFINVHTSSCDALVLFPDCELKHVSLPSLTGSRVRNLRAAWMQCLQSSELRIRGAVTLDKFNFSGRTTISGLILGRLWKWIVHPILQALDLLNHTPSHPLPHVTWCPTGLLTQLPLHAAGIYDSPQADHIFDFVVSSYTPSLSALLRCREGSSVSSPQPDMLVVAQPATPGFSKLLGTHEECARIRELLPASNFLKHEEATTAITRSVMGQYPWLHLACHGVQDIAKTTQSGFILYDGRLTLTALMEIVSDNAELAFLSACQTAVGDEKIPEESAHLAAGMLAVGFKGVVATMWSIGDADAPIIVEAYYRKLLELRNSGEFAPGYTGAAYALHEAVKVLREHVGEQNFVKWAPFVHFGV
ncbi:hypothetical protein PENSPDRAFT_623239 [Peniophora sp. CONT]|nr:hypothetical protein PENSPDRAFT_623239 [Peniophora sp. CONT]